MKSLNPCSSGSVTLRTKKLNKQKVVKSLNPCSSGSVTLRPTKNQQVEFDYLS